MQNIEVKSSSGKEFSWFIIRDNGDATLFECGECGRRLNCRGNYNKHLKDKHGKEKVSDDEIDIYVATTDGKVTHLLINKDDTNAIRYRCVKCGDLASNAMINLKRHESTCNSTRNGVKSSASVDNPRSRSRTLSPTPRHVETFAIRVILLEDEEDEKKEGEDAEKDDEQQTDASSVCNRPPSPPRASGSRDKEVSDDKEEKVDEQQTDGGRVCNRAQSQSPKSLKVPRTKTRAKTMSPYQVTEAKKKAKTMSPYQVTEAKKKAQADSVAAAR